jgi:predicted dehydrogenase
MEEADAIVEACEKHGVKFNYNTQRRYTPLYQEVRELCEKGEIGNVQCVIGHCSGAAQWTHTHTSDMLMFLAGDPEIDYIQGTVTVDEADFEDNRISTDPSIALGFVKFKNSVLGYIVSGSGSEFEVSGTKGKIRTMNNGFECQLRKIGKRNLLEEVPFPDFPIESGMVNCIKDIIEAIETGRQTKGNIQLARRSQEMIIGFVESHRLSGARVPFPLENRSLYIGRPDW